MFWQNEAILSISRNSLFHFIQFFAKSRPIFKTFAPFLAEENTKTEEKKSRPNHRSDLSSRLSSCLTGPTAVTSTRPGCAAGCAASCAASCAAICAGGCAAVWPSQQRSQASALTRRCLQSYFRHFEGPKRYKVCCNYLWNCNLDSGICIGRKMDSGISED